MRFAPAALIAALLAPALAGAQPVSSYAGGGPDTYLELHLGALLPQGTDLKVLAPGYAFGGTFGARFTRHLSVEGELGFLRATGKESGSELTLSDVPFAVSLRLRAPVHVAELSLVGGGALHVISMSSRPAAGPWWSRTATAFGWQVGGAVAFPVWTTTLVGADVRWQHVEPRFEGIPVTVDGLRIAVTLTYQF